MLKRTVINSKFTENSEQIKFKLIAENTVDIKGIGYYSLGSHRKTITEQKKEEYLRKQMEFRQYMENKMSKFTMGGYGFKNDLDLDDLSNTNAIDFKVQPNPASEVKKKKSKTQNRPTAVSIDSRDRNIKKYIVVY